MNSPAQAPTHGSRGARARGTRRAQALRRALDHKLYPGLDGHWDDRLLRAAVLRELRPEHHLLDLGAGAGIVAEMGFRGLCARVCGLDLDPRVRSNPLLDEAREGGGEAIPWPDRSFDLVLADNVLEHLEQPLRVFEEVRRVLRPGGAFVAKTPNARHYMPLVARCTPHGFHRWINARRGRDGSDTFPTRYRANTPARVRALAAEAGLIVERIELNEQRPEYLRFHPIPYRIGWAWERAVNRFPLLSGLRISMLIVLRAPLSARR